MTRLRQLTPIGVLAFGVALLLVAEQNAAQQGKQKPGTKPGEVNTPPAKGERPPERLKVGEAAPDFTLADPEGKHEVKLSAFQGKKPVVLIFGSHT